MILTQQVNAIIFDGPAPISSLPVPPLPTTDLNQLDRGLQYQQTPVYQGPTLGWVNVPVLPARFVNTNSFISPGDSTILIVGSVTLTLPNVAAWVQQPHYSPFDPFARGLWIKDLYGTAAANIVTIIPFSGQTIDNASTKVLTANYQIVRLYPLNDLTGWYSG